MLGQTKYCIEQKNSTLRPNYSSGPNYRLPSVHFIHISTYLLYKTPIHSFLSIRRVIKRPVAPLQKGSNQPAIILLPNQLSELISCLTQLFH